MIKFEITIQGFRNILLAIILTISLRIFSFRTLTQADKIA